MHAYQLAIGYALVSIRSLKAMLSKKPICSLLPMLSITCPYARFCLCTRFNVHTLAFNLVFVSSSARVIGCPRPGLAWLLDRARTLFTIQGSSTTLVPGSYPWLERLRSSYFMLDSVKRSYRPLCSTKKLIQALVLLDRYRLSTAARFRDAREWRSYPLARGMKAIRSYFYWSSHASALTSSLFPVSLMKTEIEKSYWLRGLQQRKDYSYPGKVEISLTEPESINLELILKTKKERPLLICLFRNPLPA